MTRFAQYSWLSCSWESLLCGVVKRRLGRPGAHTYSIRVLLALWPYLLPADDIPGRRNTSILSSDHGWQTTQAGALLTLALRSTWLPSMYESQKVQAEAVELLHSPAHTFLASSLQPVPRYPAKVCVPPLAICAMRCSFSPTHVLVRYQGRCRQWTRATQREDTARSSRLSIRSDPRHRVPFSGSQTNCPRIPASMRLQGPKAPTCVTISVGA